MAHPSTGTQPPRTAVVRALVELADRDPGNPIVGYARATPGLRGSLARAEALRLVAGHGAALPAGVVERLAARAVKRAPGTVRRWLRDAKLSSPEVI